MASPGGCCKLSCFAVLCFAALQQCLRPCLTCESDVCWFLWFVWGVFAMLLIMLFCAALHWTLEFLPLCCPGLLTGAVQCSVPGWPFHLCRYSLWCIDVMSSLCYTRRFTCIAVLNDCGVMYCWDGVRRSWVDLQSGKEIWGVMLRRVAWFCFENACSKRGDEFTVGELLW